jgi:BMFP domain-containing protein YqiC|tara:strand:- start:1285 stop:1536 length:252 start_codon:yes stop_codon:yes gene_type:complete
MKNSKFVFDKITKLFEQGLVTSRDIADEIMTILKSKRDEIVFKMKITSKDEFDVLSKRVENLENKLEKIQQKKKKKVKPAKRS